ncbi:thiamine pyrophosphate-binding protein [Pararobbsia silviterrae]|uniref:Thiamine pyrophosphate-binding protein n=1 Tax=Pararobbsia silviterrae TaxID=1792498 RepID=A0A494YFB9_9BURK|nr:thiamine pyrophosphate-binding protein [Pararobbsia silviterrae]RKP59073.1 thiamine pyrophosphate-binding protein [Pararobbsia silviterrae]
MKLSDYVAQTLAAHGIRHVFMVTGGGAMHLNHSLGTHPEFECVFNHHEQACAMGAEAYYRLTNRLAVVNVTSGPGGTNAITGVYGAYVDSIGMLVLSGQVKYETTVRSTGLPLRQYGDQELDIEQLVRPVTKYCEMVTDPESIRYHLEKALYLATAGRPGPVWLDIPLNVQAAQIDPATLEGFDPAELDEPWKHIDLDATSDAILAKLATAKRPVVFAGGGVRLSGQQAAFVALVEKLGIPVVTGWNAHDAVPNTNPHFVGRPGTLGDRAGNFVVQNADLLLILGSRLNIRQVSYNWAAFAREAYKIWVDIDPIELRKPTVKADMPVLANLADLLPALNARAYAGPNAEQKEWLAWCQERQRRFPVVLPEYHDNAQINPYVFMDQLFAELGEDQIIVTGNGSACVISFQAAQLKEGQRLWTNSGCASMGYDLPAAIGACKGSGDQPIVCLAGDGSIMMNLQELQTITGNRLPIKIVILNNSGYSSIFQTHRNFFKGVEVGAGPKSGVNFPDFGKLSAAFDLPFIRVATHDGIADAIRKTMDIDGPAVLEVMIDEHQPFAPKLASKQLPDGRMISPPLEDLAPFLSREEFEQNMIIEQFNESI